MLALLCGVLLAATPPAQGPVKLASPAWKFVGLDSTKGEFFADYLAQQITIQGGVQVVTNSEINSLLGFEQQKAMMGCSDSTACLAELSGALGVDGLIVGSLAKIGDGLVANLKVIKAGDGKPLAIHSKRLAGETQLLDWLTDVAGVIAQEVTRALRPDAPAVAQGSGGQSRPTSSAATATGTAPSSSAPLSATTEGPRAYPLRGWSWIPASVGVVAMTGGVMTWSGAKNAEGQLRSGEGIVTYEQVQQVRDSGFKLQVWAYSLVPVGVAALGTAAWMFFAPGHTGPTAAVLSDGKTTALVVAGSFE